MGISQQTETDRGQASAADQENCLNEVLDGVVARMGSIVRAEIDTAYEDPFVHEIVRSPTEDYLVLIEDGELRIFNKASGVEAAITGDISAYLAHTGEARKAFQAVTVGDTTFLLNRQVEVAMDSTLSPVRDNRAIAHFKAGNYKTTYTLTIGIGVTAASTTYTTPDNSSAANEEYIKTDYLAEQFRASLVSTVFPALVTAGYTPWATARVGSTLVIEGPSGVSFDILTTDGMGDKQFISFVDNVKTLADLPAKGINNFQVSVADNGTEQSSKYFLKYVGATNTGRWEEVVAPGTEIEIDPETMPHVLTNTGLNTFTVAEADWGDRLAGDGEYTALDPSFIGNTIGSLQFIGGRLAAVSEYEMALSRSRNAYVFFPDTVQTKLDTAPVDYDVSNGSTTAISHSVVAGGKLQFWGNGQQTYLDSGQDPIREDTTEILPLANYEFDGEVAPEPLGLNALLFGTAIGRWSKITEVYFRQGRPEGEIEISAHVPRLLEGVMRNIAVGEASKKSAFLTSGADTTAYLYQWYNQGQERVQSAWNKWTFPAASQVLWSSIRGSTMWLLLKWPTGCTLEYVILDSIGDEQGQAFPLRLDHRLSEADASYSSGTFTINLPYQVPSDKRSRFVAVERTDVADESVRGRDLEVAWTDDDTVTIASDNADLEFFFGAKVRSSRRMSRFYARDRQDLVIPHDRLLIKSIMVSHKDTVQYDVIVTTLEEAQEPQTYVSRMVGDPLVTNAEVPVRSGKFKATVGQETENVEIDLVNDTVFPSIWTGQKINYELTERAA